MAQGYGVWPALVAGASVHLVPRFSRATFWADVADSGATVFPFVGGILALLAEQPCDPTVDRAHHLRVAYGVPVPPALHEEFEQRFAFEVLHCYGSTEATIPVWSVPGERVVGSAGRVVEDFEVRIVDELDREVSVGDVGEICVRSSRPYTMFQGYLHDAQRTADSFRNLWFHTGDRGSFDVAGNLWFKGRSGDVIRRLGEFIDASEVEDAAASHPAVSAAAAFGVPSELAEEEVMLAAVRRTDSDVTPAELRGWVAGRVPRFAAPRFVEFVAELPVTPTGKVEKYKLRERGVTAATDDLRATKGRAT
jgi:crotonobetaine/carnitine-CoA ligase